MKKLFLISILCWLGFSGLAHADRWILYSSSPIQDCSSYLNGGKLTSSGTAVYCIDDTGISTASATSTYLTLSSATATYDQKTDSIAATRIAAGSLGTSVIASSIAVNAVTNSSIVSMDGSKITGTASIPNAAIDGSSVTKYGTSIPASVIASGSLGASVIASSIAVNAVQDASIVGVSASKLTGTGTLPNAAVDGSSVTKQANTFNGASQLVQMNSSTQLPAVSGVNLTSLNASNLASGSVADARLSANVPLLNSTQTYTGLNTFKGIKDGSSASAGNWTETVSSSAANVSVGTSGQYSDIVALSVTAGDWTLSCVVLFAANGATVTSVEYGIGTATGNNGASLNAGVNDINILPPTASSINGSSLGGIVVRPTTTTTYYLKQFISYTVATPKVYGTLAAIRNPH